MSKKIYHNIVFWCGLHLLISVLAGCATQSRSVSQIEVGDLVVYGKAHSFEIYSNGRGSAIFDVYKVIKGKLSKNVLLKVKWQGEKYSAPINELVKYVLFLQSREDGFYITAPDVQIWKVYATYDKSKLDEKDCCEIFPYIKIEGESAKLGKLSHLVKEIERRSQDELMGHSIDKFIYLDAFINRITN